MNARYTAWTPRRARTAPFHSLSLSLPLLYESRINFSARARVALREKYAIGVLCFSLLFFFLFSFDRHYANARRVTRAERDFLGDFHYGASLSPVIAARVFILHARQTRIENRKSRFSVQSEKRLERRRESRAFSETSKVSERRAEQRINLRGRSTADLGTPHEARVPVCTVKPCRKPPSRRDYSLTR